MDYSEALEQIKAGFRLSRSGWNGKGMYIQIHIPTVGKMMLPYTYIKTVDGHLVPWICSQTDAMADDWGVV